MAIQGKGAAFEREVCVKLSKWVSGGERNDIFWRNAMSGGRATVFKRKGSLLRQSGDVCAVSFEGHELTENFYFELKSYKDLEFPQFFVKGGGILGKFWNKTQDEAYSFKLRPILIVKQNRMPVLWIVKRFHMPLHWATHTKNFCVDVKHLGCAIYRFDDVMSSRYRPAEAVKRVRRVMK